MLDKVVGYLHSHQVPFRLYSDYSPEPLPEVAHPLPPGGMCVETKVVLLGGRPAILCMPLGSTAELPRLGHELGVDVIEGTAADLPAPFDRAPQPIPPLGGLVGAVLIIDERVMSASILCFDAFSHTERVELLFEDFSRIERPRIASFVVGGELPEHTEAEKPAKVA